jgi:2-oxoglutarate ferredoxin oxidoreductase subunit gamma
MHEEILCAGFGGQGIMFMARVLALAGLEENKRVSLLPSYGAEVRGGTAHCMVVISDREITSPFITRPDSGIIMNQPSLDKFEPIIKTKGLLLVNKSLVNRRPKRRDLNILELPFSDIAKELGWLTVANMVAIGSYIAKQRLLKLDSAVKALESVAGNKEILKINQVALKQGYKLALGGK